MDSILSIYIDNSQKIQKLRKKDDKKDNNRKDNKKEKKTT